MKKPVDALHRAAGANGAPLSGLALDEPRIAEAVAYIQAHYRQPLTLPEVARIVGMGKFSLSRTFSAVMRVSFRTYLLRLRVAQAAKLLEAPSPGVTEVSGLVGFGDLSRFNKMFKKYMGVSPTAYRKLAMARSAQRKARSA